MEAVPRMPMIWLELKEAGEFEFSPSVKQYIHVNYGENPENYSESLKRLEELRQTVVNLQRDFEGCSILRKYFGQLHFLQSRVPMATGQEAAVPVTWTDVFSGRNVTHNDINYEHACVLYNLGALHSILGTLDNRLSEEGMKVSCTHFQCAAGAFTYMRDHYNLTYSSDMNSQTLQINISLMLAQAQECLLEKTLLDNRKSHLIAKICAQVCDFYKDCLRVLDHSESVPGRIQKEWRKLITLKISYFTAITHLHMGKQSEEQQKFGEAVAHFQYSVDKLNEAIKQGKGQLDSVQDALKFTMDVIGGKYNSAKKDNDFIYHESVPNLDMLAGVKGASLVKPLPVTPTDPSVTGPDLFSKLVPMATHEASSLYSEEKAKLLRDIVAKIEEKNQVLERFMESLSNDSVYKMDMFKTLPDTLLEKCAYLSVRPDTVKNLVQAMQALSNVYTDVSSSLGEIRSALEEDEAGEKSLMEVVGQRGLPPGPSALQEVQKELKKYEAAHEAASQTNTELHKAMNQHIPNLRLFQGSVEDLRNSLPQPQLSQDDMMSLQKMKSILDKVDEMRKQRISLESQLRDLIHKDDITGVLVTADRAEIKTLFVEQLKKYDQLKGYIEQNLLAQGNILKALTDANVQYAPVRKTLTLTEQQWNSTVQSLIASFEAYEDLIKKAKEGRDFYHDLDKKTTTLLDKTKSYCQTRENERVGLLEKEIGKGQPPKLGQRVPVPRSGPSSLEAVGPSVAPYIARQDLPQEMRCFPPNTNFAGGPVLPNPRLHAGSPLNWPQGANPFQSARFPTPQVPNTDSKTTQLPHYLPQNHIPYVSSTGIPQQFQVRGTAPVYPQANQPTTSHVPPQGYNPALWQQPPSGPVAVSGGYTVPPQLGQMPQNCFRPGVPGPQVSMPNTFGQPQSSSAQQIIQGVPYQRHNIPPNAPRSAFPGQIFPPIQPGQFQPQQQSGLPPGYRPTLDGQFTVSQPPGAPFDQHQSALSHQFHPGQLPQVRPQPYMGYPPTSFPSSQPISAPLQNLHQLQPGSQNFPQVALSQNAQIPFGVRPSNLPQGVLPPQTNIYSIGPPHVGQQTIPPQFNTMPNGTGRPAMYAPSQSQIPSSLSVQSAVPVMDNPVPLSLPSTLIPTPSPAHVPAPEPDKINPQGSRQENISGCGTILDSLQNKVDNLSIAPQSEASNFG